MPILEYNRSKKRTIKLRIRLVMLDGTYPCSRRQLKHLRKCCDLFGFPIPVVKLALDDREGCKSAITGLMVIHLSCEIILSHFFIFILVGIVLKI